MVSMYGKTEGNFKCPSLKLLIPKDGTVNAVTLQKVGQSQNLYAENGLERGPIDAFGLWYLIWDCLDPRAEHEKWPMAEIAPEAEENKQQENKNLVTTAEDDDLPLAEEETLEDEAAEYGKQFRA